MQVFFFKLYIFCFYILQINLGLTSNAVASRFILGKKLMSFPMLGPVYPS